jgi:hypothetical protein
MTGRKYKLYYPLLWSWRLASLLLSPSPPLHHHGLRAWCCSASTRPPHISNAPHQQRCTTSQHHCDTYCFFTVHHANILQAERVARALARAELSVTARSCVTTSRVSPSPPFAVSRVVVVSSVFLLVSCFTLPLHRCGTNIVAVIYEETRGVLKTFLESVIRDAVTYTEHAKRKTVTSLDVVYALKRQGRTLYGFGG